MSSCKLRNLNRPEFERKIIILGLNIDIIRFETQSKYFLTTNHDTPLAVAESYNFKQTRDKNSAVSRCWQLQTFKCGTTMHTSGPNLRLKTNEHNESVEWEQSHVGQILQQKKNESPIKTATVAIQQSIIESLSRLVPCWFCQWKIIWCVDPTVNNKNTNKAPSDWNCFWRRDMLLLHEANHRCLPDGKIKWTSEFAYQFYTVHFDFKGFRPSCFNGSENEKT